MRSIITLVFIMFIGGYYLHLDNRGNMNHMNISYHSDSQPGNRNLFTAMLAKYPALNDGGHGNVLALSVSDAALPQNCVDAGGNLENTSSLADLDLCKSDIGLRYTAYQQYLPATNEGKSTPVSFPVISYHDLPSVTVSLHRHKLEHRRFFEAKMRPSCT